MRDLLKSLAPPIAVTIARKMKEKPRLFDGDSQMFEREVKACSVYGEYGVGQSTVFASKNASADMISVDTSKVWIEKVASELCAPHKVQFRWVDLGPVGDWGRPQSYARRDKFQAYQSAIWREARKPDLVLVDGRFRVACVLNAFLHADEGTRIIVDDYVGRPHYNVVEEFIDPREFCGRQVLFVKGKVMDRQKLADMLTRFEFVMD